MGKITIVKSACFETTSGTVLTGNIDAEAGDFLIATISVRSEITIQDDMTLVESGSIAESSTNQSLNFAYKKITVGGSQSVTVKQKSSGRIYLILIVVRNVMSINYTGDYKKTLTSNLNSSPASIVKKTENESVLWGITTIITRDGETFSCVPNDMTTVSQIRLASFADVSSNEKEHHIKYSLSESHTFLIDAVELVPYSSKYLINSGDKYYNVSSGTLNELEVTELNAEVFVTYGNDEPPNSSLLVTLQDPKIFYWTNGEDLSTIKATVTATPHSQSIISDAIDLTHSTITGIENMTTDCEGDLIVAVSFDGKQTWKAWNGTEWSTLSEEFTGMNKETLEAITFEQWNLLYQGADSFFIRVSFIDTTQSVTEICADFAN